MSDEHWLKQFWRPIMAWQYALVCLFDFILFPILNAWFSWKTGTTFGQWQPLTLKESGFYHMAMGAIIGVTAWTRGQEKLFHINSDGDRVSRETDITSQTPTKDK